MKTCSRCGEDKPLSEFSKNGDRWRADCKDCRRIWQKEYSQRPVEKARILEKTRSNRMRAQQYIQAIKEENPCTDCGDCYRYWNMQFDHLGDKEETVGRLVSIGASFDRLDAEMEKCELVCANCHGDRTHHRNVCRTRFTIPGAISVFGPCPYWCGVDKEK